MISIMRGMRRIDNTRMSCVFLYLLIVFNPEIPFIILQGDIYSVKTCDFQKPPLGYTLDHFGDGFPVSLDFHLHTAVIIILNPAGQIQIYSGVSGPITKAYALDSSVKCDSLPDHMTPPLSYSHCTNNLSFLPALYVF